MQTPQQRRAALCRLAFACAALVFAITSLSAFIRLSRAGVGCEPWPQCHAQRREMPQAQLAALDSAAVVNARIAHRIVASAALLLVIVMLVRAYNGAPALQEQGRLAAMLLALGVFLAVLGRMAGDSRSAAVVMGNLLAGFTMLALAWRLAMSCGESAPAQLTRGARIMTVAALALLLLQAALGGSLSATHEASRCGASVLCDAHRLSGLVTAAACVAVGVLAWRSGALAARVAPALAIAQGALGLAMLASGVPLALAVAHNAVAAVLGATLLSLLRPAAR